MRNAVALDQLWRLGSGGGGGPVVFIGWERHDFGAKKGNGLFRNWV